MKWLHWSPYYELHSHYSPLLNKHFMSAKIWWLIWLESLFLNHSPAANRLVAEWWLAYWNRRLSAEQVHNAAHLWSSTSMSIFIGLYSLVIIDKKDGLVADGLQKTIKRQTASEPQRLFFRVSTTEKESTKHQLPWVPEWQKEQPAPANVPHHLEAYGRTICCLISSIHSGLVRNKFTHRRLPRLSLGDH